VRKVLAEFDLTRRFRRKRALGLRGLNMKYLTVVVKPFRAEAVLLAATECGADAVTVREAKGYGRQKGYLDRYKGGEYSTAYLPKVEVCVWVAEDKYDETARALAKA